MNTPEIAGPETIENRTFDEIAIGETASLSRLLGLREIQLFALASGDVNPSHLDAAFAETGGEKPWQNIGWN